MKKAFFIHILVCVGVLLLLSPVFFETVLSMFSFDKGLVIAVADSASFDQNKVRCDIKVKNAGRTAVRFCGGRTGCGFHIVTPLPVFLEPSCETTIVVLINPCGGEVELVLYADGTGLNGLTPVKIKLPAVSCKVP
jgi:hypothetical protein